MRPSPALAEEPFIHLADGKLILADYELLVRSIPALSSQCSPASHAGQAAIDRWVLENLALISQAQLSNHQANSPIRAARGVTTAYRGVRMGRSCILPLDTNGAAVDIKGCGIGALAEPLAGEYNNGLLDLDKALEDYLKERLVDRALADAGTSFSVVHTMAIIDCGFSIRDIYGVRGPAALCVRQGFPRPQHSDLPAYRSHAHRFSFEAELHLRRCGLTSCDSKFTITQEDGRLLALADQTNVYRDYPPFLLERLVDSMQLPVPFVADRINIQAVGVRDGERESFRVVDFGHYEVRNKFEFPILSLVADRPYGWGGVLHPNADYFPQPDGTISDLWQAAPVASLEQVPRTLVQDAFAIPASHIFIRRARESIMPPAVLREEVENWLDQTTDLPRRQVS